MQIKKLDKQIAQVENGQLLEKVQADLVKNYKMKEGDYKIIIKIYEGSELQPRGIDFLLFEEDKSACDSLVQIQIRDQVKRTKVKKQTNNPIFDEQFYFNFENMSLQQLQHETIKFTVYDKRFFLLSGSVIGQFELDWTNVYFKRNHQIYRGWLTLSDPLDQKDYAVGYLLVNIAILGPDDQVTVHDSAYIKNPLTTIQETITSPRIPLIDFAIHIEIYRAQNLLPYDEITRDVDAFVVAKFSGNKIQTKVVSDLNPQWNEMLKIGTGIPTKSKYLILQVWNRNRVFGNDLLGIIRVPFTQICKQQQDQRPIWGHLYGAPMAGKDIQPYNYCSKMQLYGQTLGSTYRGRLLFKISGFKDAFTKNIRTKIKFHFPFKPTPTIPLKSYTLRVELLDGSQLPIRKQSMIHVGIGQYLMKSKIHNFQSSSQEYLEYLEDRKVMFAEDYKQIPDIIIYYAQGTRQCDRMSFVRIKANDVLTEKSEGVFKIYELKCDNSLQLMKCQQIGGYLTLKVCLFTNLPPQPKKFAQQFTSKIPYVLKIFLYQGQKLPPGNQQGDCDPQIKFDICGHQVSSKIIESTRNPVWNEVLTIQFQTLDLLQTTIQKCLVCTVYDTDSVKKNTFLGKFWLRLSAKNKQLFKMGEVKCTLLFQKPKWYHIINDNVYVGNNVFGRVLLSCAMFRKVDTSKIPANHFKNIQPKTQQKTIQLYLIGVRDLFGQKQYIKNQQLSVRMKIGNSKVVQSLASQKRHGGCHINKLYDFKVEVPKNKNLCPFLDLKFCGLGNQSFYGYNSISLYELLPRLKQSSVSENIQKPQEDEETILNVQNLQKQIELVVEYRKEVALKNRKKKKKFQNTQVEKLPLPNEFGQLNNQNSISYDKKLQFDKLIQQFKEIYQLDPQFSYVRQLEEKNDSDQIQKAKIFKLLTFKAIEDVKDNNQQQSQRQDQFLINMISPHVNFSIERPKDKEKDEEKGKDKIKNKEKQKEKDKKLQFKTSQPSNIMKRMTLQPQFNKSKQKISQQGSIKQEYKDLQNRFSMPNLLTKITQIQEINNFQIKSNDQFSEMSYKERAIKYKDVEEALKQQQLHQKQAIERDKQYKYAAAVKLSLFGWRRKKKQFEIQSYQDYDTDPQQNLDIIPEWYKGRKILATDFEDLNWKNKKLHTIPIFRGRKKNIEDETRVQQKIASVKLIAISQTNENALQKQIEYSKLMKPKSYVCRVYVLKGKSLLSNYDIKPTTMLKFSYGGQEWLLKNTEVVAENNPQYYICHQIQIQLPGPATIRIDVMQSHKLFGKLLSTTLGHTQIDLEERYFTKKWHLYTEKKPIQLRNLYSQYGSGTQGRLQTWIQLIPKKKWLSTPMHKIHPPPFYSFQLRVIVWQTASCVYKNVKLESNDIFVRAMIGGLQPQQTDTHWSCRDTANFNYRFKFAVNYPPKPEDMYSDILIVQIWDRDIIGYNNLIGQTRINLNRIHRIIEKAVKRRKPVKASMKIREQGLKITDRFWFSVLNHRQRNQFGQLQPQGKVQLSFQLVPIKQAKQELANGYGRSEPNVYPTLPDPPGRLNFDLLHPLDFLKQIIGNSLYDKIRCRILICFLIIILVALLYFILGQIVSVSIFK